jgi:hypothetical protein
MQAPSRLPKTTSRARRSAVEPEAGGDDVANRPPPAAEGQNERDVDDVGQLLDLHRRLDHGRPSSART